MAIAIRGTTPAVATSGTATVATTLSGTRQPQAGDLLVIIHFNDYYTLAAMPTPTVGGSTSGVTAITNGTVDGGANIGHIKSYTYAVGSTGDLTVSVTETGAGDEEKGLVVYVLSGADTAAPISGGSAGAAGTFDTNSLASHVLTGVTPAEADAFLIGHDSSGTSSTPSGYTTPGTEQYDGTFAGFLSYCGWTEQLSASGATGTRTVTPGTSCPFHGLVVTIKTASGGGGGGSGAGAAFLSWALPVLGIGPGKHPVARPFQMLGALDVPTLVVLADTATATDAATVAVTLPLTDTGVANDALSAAATVTLAETATGADAMVVTVPVALAETATGTDGLAVTASTTFTDTATAADAVTVAVAVALADTAAGADAAALTASVPLAETGTGADALTVPTVAAQLTETASAADSMTAQDSTAPDPHQAPEQVPWMFVLPEAASFQALGSSETTGASLVMLSDTATAADALASTVTVLLAEAVTGADVLAIGGLPVSLTDTVAGTDAATVTVTAPLADTATTVDAATTVATVTLTDTATAADALTGGGAGPGTIPDTATAADTLTVTTTAPLTDTATAADALTTGTTSVTLTDTATAADALTLTRVLADTVTAADALTVTVTVPLADTATTLYALAVLAAATLTDTAAAVDAVTAGPAGVGRLTGRIRRNRLTGGIQ